MWFGRRRLETYYEYALLQREMGDLEQAEEYANLAVKLLDSRKEHWLAEKAKEAVS